MLMRSVISQLRKGYAMTITKSDLNEMASEFGNRLVEFDRALAEAQAENQSATCLVIHGKIEGVRQSINMLLAVAYRSNNQVDKQRFYDFVEDVRTGRRDIDGKLIKQLKA